MDRRWLASPGRFLVFDRRYGPIVESPVAIHVIEIGRFLGDNREIHDLIVLVPHRELQIGESGNRVLPDRAPSGRPRHVQTYTAPS